MILFDRVSQLAKKQGKSLKSVAEDLGLSRNAIYQWKKSSPKAETLQAVADYFDVTTDYLLGRDDKKYYKLSDKENRDIGIEAERLLEGLQSGSEVSFFGEPMTEEEKAQMLTILELGLRMNKEKAKKKFTPKKYRENE